MEPADTRTLLMSVIAYTSSSVSTPSFSSRISMMFDHSLVPAAGRHRKYNLYIHIYLCQRKCFNELCYVNTFDIDTDDPRVPLRCRNQNRQLFCHLTHMLQRGGRGEQKELIKSLCRSCRLPGWPWPRQDAENVVSRSYITAEVTG